MPPAGECDVGDPDAAALNRRRLGGPSVIRHPDSIPDISTSLKGYPDPESLSVLVMAALSTAEVLPRQCTKNEASRKPSRLWFARFGWILLLLRLLLILRSQHCNLVRPSPVEHAREGSQAKGNSQPIYQQSKSS